MASHADSAHDLLNLPISNLRQYIELFPNEGLSKVVTGYLSSGISRHPLRDKPKDSPDLSEGGVALNIDDPLTQEDCLVLMTVSIHNEHNSSYVLIGSRKVYKRRTNLH
jgi:superkiller protein 3